MKFKVLNGRHTQNYKNGVVLFADTLVKRNIRNVYIKSELISISKVKNKILCVKKQNERWINNELEFDYMLFDIFIRFEVYNSKMNHFLRDTLYIKLRGNYSLSWSQT